MDFAIVSPFLHLVDAFKRPTDSPPASSAESSPRPSGPELWLLREPEGSMARERAPQGSAAGGMGRLGQDKPAFGWELEPFWPSLPIGGAPEPVTPPGANCLPGVFCPELSGLPCGGEMTL